MILKIAARGTIVNWESPTRLHRMEVANRINFITLKTLTDFPLEPST